VSAYGRGKASALEGVSTFPTLGPGLEAGRNFIKTYHVKFLASASQRLSINGARPSVDTKDPIDAWPKTLGDVLFWNVAKRLWERIWIFRIPWAPLSAQRFFRLLSPKG
jgi:hypothetical protein